MLPTASSGIAASNIATGRTSHSRFKLPVDDEPSSTCYVGKQTSLAQLLKEASLIIWDELSMGHKHNIEALDAIDRPRPQVYGCCSVDQGRPTETCVRILEFSILKFW